MASAVRVRKPKVTVRGDTETTPQGAEWRGEIVTLEGKQKKVFWEKYEIAEHEEVRTPDGHPVYKRGPGGIVLNVTLKRRVVKGMGERDFVLEDFGNGQVGKNYNFRATLEAEQQAVEAERRDAELKQFEAELLETLKEEGVSVRELVSAVKGEESKRRRKAS